MPSETASKQIEFALCLIYKKISLYLSGKFDIVLTIVKNNLEVTILLTVYYRAIMQPSALVSVFIWINFHPSK